MYIFVPLLTMIVFLAFYALIEMIAYRKLISLGRKYKPTVPIDTTGQTLLDVAATFFWAMLAAVSSQKISMVDRTRIEELATKEMKRIEGILAPYYHLKRLSQFCAACAIVAILVFVVLVLYQGTR